MGRYESSALNGFDSIMGPQPPGFAEMLWLSRSGDLAESAANLFAMLRQLDRPPFTGIAVMPNVVIPDDDPAE